MSFRSKFKLLQLFVVGVFMAALMAACGSTATNTSAPASATTAASAATTAPASAATTAPASAATTAPASAATTAGGAATTAPANAATSAAPAAQGGTFRYRQSSEAKTLDPGFITDATSISIAQNLFEGLVELNPKLEVVPAAAEALPTVSADGKTYTFKLKKNLKWSNGDPLTAKDFVYAWNRVAQLGSAAEYASVMYPIVGFEEISTSTDEAKRKTATVPGIKLVDDYTIEVTLTDPVAYFLTESALWTYWPVNQKAVESKGDKFDPKNPWSTEAANLVSNGAFTLKEWKHDVSMRIEPNPNYTGTVKPSIAAVTVDIIKDDTTAKLKFDNNELDDTIVPVADIPNVKKDAKYKESYKEVPATRTNWLAFNMGKDNAFSKNLKLRQAIWYALDRQLVTDGALNGAAVPTTVLLPEGLLGYKKLDSYPFNLDKAKQLLKEAGFDTPDKVKALSDEINNYGGGRSGGIAYNADTSSNKAYFENVQQQLKTNLGLDLKLNPVATFKEFLQRRDTDKEFLGLYRGSWGADYPDPQNFYESLFFSTSGNNTDNYKNPKYDEVVKKANTAQTTSQRAELYQQAEQILQQDAAYVPVFNGIQTFLVRPTLQNYGYNAQGPTVWKYMSIKR